MKDLAIFAIRSIFALCFMTLLAKGTSWSEMVGENLAQMADPPSVQDLIILARYSGVESDDPKDKEARGRAQERLRRVTDLGEQLAAHIRQEREKWVTEEGVSSSGYNRERAHVLGLMGNLPDPNVVKVLGEFLPDVEWPGYEDELEAMTAACPPPNAILASEALGRLIEKPPVRESAEGNAFDDAKVWELWYAQVKAGTRTFQFKGDPRHYTLKGLAADTVQPSEARRPKDFPAVSSASSTTEKRTRLFPGLAIATTCGAALWYLVRQYRRKQRSAA